MENANTIRLDDHYVYSVSGKPYPRLRPRDRNHVRERRLPFIKRVTAKGHRYLYFVGPGREVMARLPEMDDPGFDNAYLAALAALEGVEAPPFLHPSNSRVYFIGAEGGGIKIGVALDVAKRLKEIQAHCPLRLSVLATAPGDRTLEQAYHKRFAAHRMHGEWFTTHREILAEIERVKAHAS